MVYEKGYGLDNQNISVEIPEVYNIRVTTITARKWRKKKYRELKTKISLGTITRDEMYIYDFIKNFNKEDL